MPAYVVQGRDPRRIATAVVRYQLREPRFALVLVACLAAFAIVGAFSGPRGSLGGVVFALIVIVLVTEFKRRQLALQLARRGFRPGSTLETAADDEALSVVAPHGTAQYPWHRIAHARTINSIALFRLAGPRIVIAVPVEAMPEGWSARVGAAPPP